MTKEQIQIELKAYFAKRKYGQKVPEAIKQMIFKYLIFSQQEGKTLRCVSDEIGCQSKHLYHYPAMLGLDFKTNYLKKVTENKQVQKAKKPLKAISEIIEDDIIENRFFSIMIVGAKPEALQRISYKTTTASTNAYMAL